jgi:DNA-binding MarR family transcriptional regulator
MTVSLAPASREAPELGYRLEDQVGFILRQVYQRHAALFAAGIGVDLTPTQWAALAKLHEAGPLSQNLLGRQTAMDAATIKGVIDRLTRRGLTETRADPDDARRLMVGLTAEGVRLVESTAGAAARISEDTLAPLSVAERRALVSLLSKLR